METKELIGILSKKHSLKALDDDTLHQIGKLNELLEDKDNESKDFKNL